MRRVLRHLLTFCSALSLLLCMAVCVLWVRSYSTDDRLGQWTRQIEGEKGSFVVERVRGAYSHRGSVYLISGMESVLRSGYEIEKRRRPVLMRRIGLIRESAVEWPLTELKNGGPLW